MRITESDHIIEVRLDMIIGDRINCKIIDFAILCDSSWYQGDWKTWEIIGI